MGRDTHGFVERAEMSIEPRAIVAYQNDFARLIRRYHQADLQLLEQRRQITGVDAA